MEIGLKTKLHGGAMYYAIFMGFILCLISTLFLFTARIHNQYTVYYNQVDRLRDNLSSSLQLLLEYPSIVTYNNPIWVDIFDDSEDSVYVLKSHWGAYSLLKISAEWGNLKNSKNYLIGDNFSSSEPIALYVKEKNNYLSISGKTNLNGILYLPKLGIRESNIESSFFSSNKISNNEIKRSAKLLPKPDSIFITYLKKMLQGEFEKNANIVNFETAIQWGEKFNSFSNPTLYLYSKNKILIDEGLKLSGNIVVYSSKQITINNKAKLNNIVCFSPIISVLDEFKGNVQLFASDTLKIGNNSKFFYPSYLGIYNSSINNCEVKIGTQNLIEGGVFIYQTTKTVKEPHLLLDTDSKVVGQIYCNGNFEMKGSVIGSVYTNGFNLITPSTFYENHLLNATIDFKSLPTAFAGFDVTSKSRKQKLIECIE